MTIKELKKWINEKNNISVNNDDNDKKPEALKLKSELFEIFRNKPFWYSDVNEHRKADIANKGACCFNHIIGLPRKDGISHKIYDYEMDVFNALQSHRDILIKKARGLGITELLLRYISWLCTKDDTYKNCRFHIVTGPRIQLAEELINRLHNLFMDKLGIDCKQVGPIIYINNVTVQAFPSHTVSTMRGYTDVKLILLDEADYFPIGQREEARAVVEGYRAKTSPALIFVSTPNRPGGLFDTMEHEDNSSYYKVLLPYTLGLDKIYSSVEIEKEKLQGYFNREYNLQYGYGLGNCFMPQEIELAIQKGLQYQNYDPKVNPNVVRSLGLDPAFGSSRTGIIITELVDGLIRVVYCKQFDSSSTSDITRIVTNLIADYNLMDHNLGRVYVDASQPGLVRSIKANCGEITNYQLIIEKAKQNGHKDINTLYHYMQIIPVPFQLYHKAILAKVKKWLSMGRLALHPDMCQDLITELRIAESTEEFELNKKETSHDLLDALRLSMCWYND